MPNKPVVSGFLSVLFCMFLIFIFNKPAIPIAIGMGIGAFIFFIGYILGFC